MKKVFLLDAYALIFRSYYAFIKNPRVNSKGLNTSAIFGFTNTLLELIRKEKPDYLSVCFDPSGPNFRHELYPEYKANRDATPEDIKKSIPYIKDIISAFNISQLELAGYEADDVVGTVAKKLAHSELQVFMMTPDKDYAQLVDENIFMYKPRRSGSDVDILGIEEVREKFGIEDPIQVIDILALWGDSADNIPGAPGIGEKTSKKLIAEYGSIEKLLENTDDLKGKQRENLENYAEQVRLSKALATIKLDVPIDFKLEEMAFEPVNTEEIKRIFTELEFRTLLSKVAQFNGEEAPVKAKQDASQLDMFADNTEVQASTSLYSNIEDTKHLYTLVDTDEAIEALIEKLKNQKSWCFDTETTDLDAINAQLVGISFSWEKHKAYYIPFPESFENAQILIRKFKAVFENRSIEKVGQNLKYDILVLKKYDIHVKGDLFDTMIAHYLLQPDQRHNMDFLSESFLAYKPVSIETLIGKKGKNQGNMKDVDLEKIKEYAAEDADITWQLSEIFRKELDKKYLSDLYFEIEMPLISVLADMEFKGVSLDTEYLNAYSKTLSLKIETLEKNIYEIAGEAFNIGSPKQLGIILFDKLKITDKPPLTKTKQYKTGEDIISKFKDAHPIIELILSYRGLKKLVSTYVDALPLLVNPKTNRIHTSFNQAVAATGRLSSTNPNLQNIPIREAEGREVRKAFTSSDDDHVFLSADYSQVELRLMAHLSQDENMIEAFKAGLDIHTATAAKILKKPIEEVTKEERSQAKSANFGIIYGISAFGLSQNINMSRKDAKALIDGYFDTYPKVKIYMDKSIELARSKGYVSTLFGRRRNLSDINSQNAIVRGVAERNAINAPIQGTAADVIKLAMIHIHEAFEEKGLKSEMLIQVHDELNFNVLKSELETVKEIVKTEMERAVSLSVPLDVDMGEGVNWLEAH
jgi:DNA polymerase-1